MAVIKSKKDIRKLTSDELESFFTKQGEKPFRARQVYEWLYKKSCTSFDEMTNLSLGVRKLLHDHYVINSIKVHNEQISTDRTIKQVYKLHDEHLIEGVLIPSQTRMTACISSQAGCALGCKFCATGYMGLKRSLEAAEIYDQVVFLNRLAMEKYGYPLSNIVLMGMGEPLLNYSNVMQALEWITTEKGLGISYKRITLSTSGIVKMISRMADEGVRIKLAVSLHACDDEKRNNLMPINESNNLEALKKSLINFHRKTENDITLEYILLGGFNDTESDARNLIRFASHFPCKINLIEYNPIVQASYIRPKENQLEQFMKVLEKRGLVVNLRRSRGKDIDAACGQLATREESAVNSKSVGSQQ